MDGEGREVQHEIQTSAHCSSSPMLCSQVRPHRERQGEDAIARDWKLINLQINLQNRDRAGFSLALTALPLQVKEEPHSFRVAFLTYRKHCTNPCLTKCTEMCVLGGKQEAAAPCAPISHHGMNLPCCTQQVPPKPPSHHLTAAPALRMWEPVNAWRYGAVGQGITSVINTGQLLLFFFVLFFFFPPLRCIIKLWNSVLDKIETGRISKELIWILSSATAAVKDKGKH